jgi:hypothetical protein
LRATGIIPSFHKPLAQKGIDLPIETFSVQPGDKRR